MSKTVKIILAAVIILGIAGGLLYTGIWIGRFGVNPFSAQWDGHRWGGLNGYRGEHCPGSASFRGPGRMGGIFRSSPDLEPLSDHEIEDILEDYLKGLSDPDLVLSDIMIFDNHAYAQILETSTGIGAMEVLVDYEAKQVYPEHGPNMMWNLKYSPMAVGGDFHGRGMMAGRAGYSSETDVDLENFSEMPISSEQAVAAAQEYLDQYLPGIDADDHAVMFYGYYTLHTLDGEEVEGMLSVNGYSGQVFYHDWHGELLESADHDDDH